MGAIKAHRFLISGRVQGVGYRYFAERSAHAAGVTGWARNLDDGSVEAHANGTQAQLDDFEARLRQGPRFADVRSVQVSEVPVLELSGFHIR
ncbi:MAG TPA: acylphosphatase [Bryobacteraceae bacterium]|jgi:acylphosphatase|nr:acylphosphatase [Bryobacteraceae bacterium]